MPCLELNAGTLASLGQDYEDVSDSGSEYNDQEEQTAKGRGSKRVKTEKEAEDNDVEIKEEEYQQFSQAQQVPPAYPVPAC